MSDTGSSGASGFMKHDGIVICKVTSSQHRHSEIAGDFEIPCPIIRFTADPAIIEWLKSLLMVSENIFSFDCRRGAYNIYLRKNGEGALIGARALNGANMVCEMSVLPNQLELNSIPSYCRIQRP